MDTETKTVQDYKLKGNLITEVPIVGNLIWDEFGQEVLARHNERFRGIKGIEDTYDYKKGQPISYSNVPRVLSYNMIMRVISPNTHLLSPSEVVNYWDAIPEKDSTYADTDSIAVFPKECCNEDLRKRVLGILGRSKIAIPLIVSGLGVDPVADGFIFTETDYIKTEEAPFLEKDGKVEYDAKKGIIPSENGISIHTPPDQKGLRWLCRDWSDLYAGCDDLLVSDSDGRVQLIQDPKGRTENLEAKLKLLQEQRDRDLVEVNARYERASNHLRTGKF